MSDEKPAYVLVDVKITNFENYERYKGLAKPLIEKFGGEYVRVRTCQKVRGGETRDIERMLGLGLGSRIAKQ